jgi:hypothetical protein
MIETIYDHTVHPRYLGPQSEVLDLGANYGLFAKAITARFGCRRVARRQLARLAADRTH